MFWAAFYAAAAVHAIGIAEQTLLCLAWREEAEGARLGAKSAFHTSVGDANATLHWPHCLVYFPHRADGTPEVTVEDQPPNEAYGGRDGYHDVQQHSPAA